MVLHPPSSSSLVQFVVKRALAHTRVLRKPHNTPTEDLLSVFYTRVVSIEVLR